MEMTVAFVIDATVSYVTRNGKALDAICALYAKSDCRPDRRRVQSQDRKTVFSML